MPMLAGCVYRNSGLLRGCLKIITLPIVVDIRQEVIAVFSAVRHACLCTICMLRGQNASQTSHGSWTLTCYEHCGPIYTCLTWGLIVSIYTLAG